MMNNAQKILMTVKRCFGKTMENVAKKVNIVCKKTMKNVDNMSMTQRRGPQQYLHYP